MAYGVLNKWTPPRKSGGIPFVSTRFSLSVEMSRLTRTGTAKFSGANGDRELFIFHSFSLFRRSGSSRIGNITRLIHTLAVCDDYTYINSVL